VNATLPNNPIQVFDLAQPLADFRQITYAKASSGVAIPAGKRTLTFSTTGTTPETLETTLELEFLQGNAYLYTVTGAGVTNSPLLLSEEVGIEGGGSTPTPDFSINIRLVNALTGVGALDLYIGDEPLLRDVNFGEGSALARTSAIVRPVKVKITRAGSDQALATITLASAPEGQMLFVAVGDATNPQLFQSAEPARSGIGFSILHLIHAVPGGPRASLESPNAPPARTSRARVTPTPGRTVYLREVRPLDISQIVQLRQGAQTLIVRDIETNAEIAQFADLNIQREKRYIILLVPEGDSFRVSLITTDDALR
jgi:hypothetical protein